MGWASLSTDTGLTEAQEDFVVSWSPRDVLNHCSAQHELVSLLEDLLRTYPDTADINLAIAILHTFCDALPLSAPSDARAINPNHSLSATRG